MILISVITVILSSCEDQDINDQSNDSDYFPNTIHSNWKYERFDSLTNSIDTIHVSITGDTLISNDIYKIWNYKYSDRNEKLYVSQSNDSVIIFNTLIGRFDQIYIIPFEIGLGWINPDYHFDTSYVSKIQNLSIDEITYQDVVLIERSAFCCNDYLIEKIWIKPKIGLIKLERKHFILGPYKNETWKLIKKYIE